MCARRRSNFLLSRQEKVTKEKATLLSASLRFAAGNLQCSFAGCAVELALRLRRAARTTTASQITKRVCPAAHPPPHALRSSAHTEGGEKVQTAARAIALLGLACAARGACARGCRAERSDGPCGLRSSNPLLAAPAAVCLRGGMRVGARMLRPLTRRVCPNGAAQQRSELCGAPRKRPAAGLPRSEAQGPQTVGRVSLPPFLSRDKKGGRPPGRVPASDLRKAPDANNQNDS